MEDHITPEELKQYLNDMKIDVAKTINSLVKSFDEFDDISIFMSKFDNILSNIDEMIEEL